jgi:mono/diheme cytochrome c family protein
MSKFLRWLGIGFAGLVGALLILASLVYALSNKHINKRYTVGATWVAVPRDPALVARGAHLAQAVTKCVVCHGEDLGGTMFIDAPAFARIAAPNLTAGRGGAGGRYTDQELARVIQHGVKRDRRGAVIMPAEAFTYLSDADLAAVIAYVRSVPPVDREWPAPKFGPVARTLLAFGKLPVFPAEQLDHERHNPMAPPADTTPAYGRYLTQIGGCSNCHNPSYSGGKMAAGDPEAPAAVNLTPAGIGDWTEADFVRVLREGKRFGGGAPINDRFMPWKSSGRMTDAEIHAVWLFLKTLPPKEFGVR